MNNQICVLLNELLNHLPPQITNGFYSVKSTTVSSKNEVMPKKIWFVHIIWLLTEYYNLYTILFESYEGLYLYNYWVYVLEVQGHSTDVDIEGGGGANVDHSSADRVGRTGVKPS